jgi:hypothetical protein
MDWRIHGPFINDVPYHQPTPNITTPSNPKHIFTEHLSPFSTPMPTANPTKTLRICMQNTQYSFQIDYDSIDITNIAHNLKI